MPLGMPATDQHVGKCGMQSSDPHSVRSCNKPSVGRVAVPVAGHDDDYDYQYSSEFRATAYGDVMVDFCEEHQAEMNEEFAEAAAKVADREDRQTKAAADIHALEDQLKEAKRAYPGVWRG